MFSLKFTEHANRRMSERKISTAAIKAALKHGHLLKKSNTGVKTVGITSRTIKQLNAQGISDLDKFLGTRVVYKDIDAIDLLIITTYIDATHSRIPRKSRKKAECILYGRRSDKRYRNCCDDLLPPSRQLKETTWHI
jgi:hypothetical protein